MKYGDLLSELKASIRMNAHDGVEPITLDRDSLEEIAIAVLASIERLGLAIVPTEPTEAMLKTSLGISHATKLPSFESRIDLRPSIWKHMLAASPLRKGDRTDLPNEQTRLNHGESNGE